MKKQFDIVATTALIGSVLCWATIPLFLKYFTAYVDAWTANGIRYPFAALLFVPWLIHFHKKGVLQWRHWKLAIFPVVVNTISQIMWAWAPYYIDAGFMTFLVRLSVLWVVLGSFILFRDERELVKSGRFWLGFILAIVGFIAMTVASKPLATRSTFIGVILVLFVSVGWAAYQLSVRKNLQQIDSRAGFGMISVLTSIGLLTCMFSFGEYDKVATLEPVVTIMLLLSGLIGIAAAHLLFYIAVKRIGVAIASSANLSATFLTAFFSMLLFGEKLSAIQWFAGVILIAGGILLTQAQVHVVGSNSMSNK